MALKELAGYLRVPAAKLAPYLTLRGKKRIAAQKIGRRWEISAETAQDWLLTVYEEQVARAKPQPPAARNKTKSKMSTHAATERTVKRGGA